MQPFTFGALLPSLRNSRRILLAGCGGGSDVFGALPIYFALQQASHTAAAATTGAVAGDAPAGGFEVHLASLTSADEKDVARHPGQRHGENLLEVRYSSIMGPIKPLSTEELSAQCDKWTLASHLTTAKNMAKLSAGGGVVLVEPQTPEVSTVATRSTNATDSVASLAATTSASTLASSTSTSSTSTTTYISPSCSSRLPTGVTLAPTATAIIDPSSSSASSSTSSSSSPTCISSPVDPFHGVYFQEHRLSKFFAECKGQDVPIYTIPTTRGTMGVTDGYATLCKLLNIDTIILVDVGIDSLCFGREADLGTPVEDMMSVAAIAQMPSSQVHTKILTCFGVGLEPCGEINFFHNLSVLQNEGAFLGTICLVPQMPEAIAYCQAVRYCGSSTLNGTLSASLEGKFGRQLILPTGQEVNEYDCFAQPLAQLYWFFDLHSVSRRIEYLHCIIGSTCALDVRHAITGWRTRERLQDGKRQGSGYCGPQSNIKIDFRHPVCAHNGPIAAASSLHGSHSAHHTHDIPASETDEDPMPRPVASPMGPPLPMVKLPTTITTIPANTAPTTATV